MRLKSNLETCSISYAATVDALFASLALSTKPGRHSCSSKTGMCAPFSPLLFSVRNKEVIGNGRVVERSVYVRKNPRKLGRNAAGADRGADEKRPSGTDCGRVRMWWREVLSTERARGLARADLKTRRHEIVEKRGGAFRLREAAKSSD